MRHGVLVAVTILWLSSFVIAQSVSPSVNPQAASALGTSLASLVGNSSVQDVKLTGSAQWSTAPSDSSGPVTLEALSNNLSRIDVGAASISEVRDSSSAIPLGWWKDADGQVHEMATHNCWSPANWFVPYGFITAALGNDAILSYIGLETQNGASVVHLRYYRNIAAKSRALASLWQRLTTVDLFLDSTTYLLLTVDFNLHPDEDPNTDLPVELRLVAHTTFGSLCGVVQYLCSRTAPLKPKEGLNGPPAMTSGRTDASEVWRK